MDQTILLTVLYDFYKELLTSTQRSYFEDYYFSNLTLSEMAENYNVSRNAISKQLKQVAIKLEDYESKLQLKNKRETILKICENNKELQEQIDNIL